MLETKSFKFKVLPHNIELARKLFNNCLTTLPHQFPFPNSTSLDSVTYTKLVQSSVKGESLLLGKLVHSHIIRACFRPCLFLLNNMLNMYCKHRELDFAQKLFDKMPKRDVVSWNLLIYGYYQMGFYERALILFNEARMSGFRLDKFTYASILNVCAHIGELELGKLIHGLLIVSGFDKLVFLTNSLIEMYFNSGGVDQARLVFDYTRELDTVSWNTMISGYVRQGLSEETMELLVKMHQSGMKLNNYALGSVLKACSSSFYGSLECGKMIHGCAVKLGLNLDVVGGTALLDMYAKIGDLDNAISIFKAMPNHNVVMYNAMIAAFIRTESVSCEPANQAIQLYIEMQRQGMKPSKFTFSSVLKACNGVEAFEHGKQLHAQVFKNNLESDEFIASSLVELYSLLGSTGDSLKCFNATKKLDIVSWTTMIAGLVQNGQFESALSLFYELLASGRKPDEFTISSALCAAADSTAARSGEQVQAYATKSGIGYLTSIRNSLVCMYSKAGNIDSANQAFQETHKPDVVSWSVMIYGNAQHGCAKEALALFESMKGTAIVPNHITYLGVLMACSHRGLVDEGLRHSGLQGDVSNPMSVMIYRRLEELLEEIRKMGYMDERPAAAASFPEQKESRVFQKTVPLGHIAFVSFYNNDFLRVWLSSHQPNRMLMRLICPYLQHNHVCNPCFCENESLRDEAIFSRKSCKKILMQSTRNEVLGIEITGMDFYG
ncbi:Pentatricopeptide repeat [Dillenia turbinata]|uniref:Pentatricopeptide repeat n=1 Tax=Dillenia turbinata TaxID=194707 RepID=A0AAN8W259_9MAGN